MRCRLRVAAFCSPTHGCHLKTKEFNLCISKLGLKGTCACAIKAEPKGRWLRDARGLWGWRKEAREEDVCLATSSALPPSPPPAPGGGGRGRSIAHIWAPSTSQHCTSGRDRLEQNASVCPLRCSVSPVIPPVLDLHREGRAEARGDARQRSQLLPSGACTRHPCLDAAFQYRNRRGAF